jgi:acetyl esterase/lipase
VFPIITGFSILKQHQVTGDCLYADWFGAFWIPFIHRTSSIVVLPNYRLIPESTGADILIDLSDFWTWFNAGSVTDFLASKHDNLSLDHSQTLVTGDSAGGYMALMSALTQPAGSIKAVLAQYPMTNYMRVEPGPTFFGMPSPGPEIVDQHISQMVPVAVVSSATPPQRSGLSYGLAAYGKYLHYFGAGEKLWPLGKLEDAKEMPPTWIIHGEADQAVDVKDSQAFVRKWTDREVMGEVKLDVLPGMDHGFDIVLKEDEEAWLREGLKWIEGKWLS